MRSRIRQFLPSLAALLGLAMLSPSAFAQGSSDLRISVFGGASLLSGDRTFVIGNTLYESSYSNGARFGARVTGNLDDHWAAEGSYAFSTNDLKIANITIPQERKFDARAHQFTGNALYYISSPDAMVRPYGTVGIGITHFSVTGSAKTLAAQQFLDVPSILQGENKLGINFGAGVEAKPWERLGVRVEFRDNITGMPHFGLPEARTSPLSAFYPVSGSLNRVEVTAGVVYYISR